MLFSQNDLAPDSFQGKRPRVRLAMLSCTRCSVPVSSVYSRQLLRRLSPMVVDDSGQMFFADLLAWLLVPWLEPGLVLLPRSLLTLVRARLDGRARARAASRFWFYRQLVTHWGASRSALTNYIVPGRGPRSLELCLGGRESQLAPRSRGPP